MRATLKRKHGHLAKPKALLLSTPSVITLAITDRQLRDTKVGGDLVIEGDIRVAIARSSVRASASFQGGPSSGRRPACQFARRFAFVQLFAIAGTTIVAHGCTVIHVRAGTAVETSTHLGQLTVRVTAQDPVVVHRTVFGAELSSHRFAVGYVDDRAVHQPLRDHTSLLIVGDLRKLGMPSCRSVYLHEERLTVCRILEDEK